jgi:hypothetical protein
LICYNVRPFPRLKNPGSSFISDDGAGNFR